MPKPGVLLFMSNWYKKAELARRFSIFYCASLVSGAVGGLIGMYRSIYHVVLIMSNGFSCSWPHRDRHAKPTTSPCLEVAVFE